MRIKNECLKTRPATDPYEVWVAGEWKWRVMKKYQVDDNKPFARWLCAVSSPLMHGGFEIGDCYVKDIVNHAVKVKEEKRP